MYSVDWFKDKKITVMGLGLHGGGVGMAKWLMRHGAAVTVTDLKGPEELADSIAELDRAYQGCLEHQKGPPVRKIVYSLGSHAEKDFVAADMVIKNPAVPRENPFLSLTASKGIPVETDISIFFLLCPYPSTAVTGTKGKTTTTTLLADISRAHDKRTVVGGNIRISPLDALDKLLQTAKKGAAPPPPIVLELSSWQLESLEKHHLSPRIGVMTNIMEDHLNRYRGMEDYARAKELMVSFQGAGDTAVLNVDDPRIAAIGEKLALKQGGPRLLWFSVKSRKGEGCFVSGGKVVIDLGGRRRTILPLSAVRIPGKHNLGNVLAACAAAAAMGIPDRTIAAVVRKFRGVPGRLEFLGVKGGVHFFNDTTATTPDAAMAAMRTLVPENRKRIVLLAGGADKELRFEEWAKVVAGRVKHLVLFSGTATPKMLAALDAAGVRTPRTVVGSMAEAMRIAKDQAKPPGTVLLSPGCASFGMFVNEFDRGDQFVKAVKRIRS